LPSLRRRISIYLSYPPNNSGTQDLCQQITQTQTIKLASFHSPRLGFDMTAEVTTWSLFDHHCFCEEDGSCMQRLFADENYHEIPIGHQDCIRSPSSLHPRDNRPFYSISVPGNSGSSTLIDNSPGPSESKTSHSTTMTEATTALEKSNAIDTKMTESHLPILDTVKNAPHIENTSTFSEFNTQKPEIRFQGFQKCDMTGYETMFDEPVSSVLRGWSFDKILSKFGRLLRYLCGLPREMKSVDVEEG